MSELWLSVSYAEFEDLSFEKGPGRWVFEKQMILLNHVWILALVGSQKCKKNKNEMMDEMGLDGFKFGIFDWVDAPSSVDLENAVVGIFLIC